MNDYRATLQGLYAITDPALIASEDLEEKVTAAINGGASIIQYRNKNAADEQQLSEAVGIANLCRERQIPLLVNDNTDLALSVGAAGVHLGQSDLDIAAARAVLGPEAIIGVSCHNDLGLALTAADNGADYIAFGRFFPSQTKPEAPMANLDIILRTRSELSIPIVAIGGITPENGAPLIAAGANMLAAIHGLFGQSDIEAAARSYTQLF